MGLKPDVWIGIIGPRLCVSNTVFVFLSPQYPASGTPLFMTQCGDDFNALQCELIATRRSNDALVLENNVSVN